MKLNYKAVTLMLSKEMYDALLLKAGENGLLPATMAREIVIEKCCPELLEPMREVFASRDIRGAETRAEQRRVALEKRQEQDRSRDGTVKADIPTLPLPTTKLTDDEIAKWLKRGIKPDYLCARYKIPWKRVYEIKEAMNG